MFISGSKKNVMYATFCVFQNSPLAVESHYDGISAHQTNSKQENPSLSYIEFVL